MAGCFRGEVEAKLAHGQLLGGRDVGQPPREGNASRQRFALFFRLHQQRQTVVLESTENKGFLHIAAFPKGKQSGYICLQQPEGRCGVDFRGEWVLAQLHQVSTEANRYRGRVGDLDIPGDHQWTEPVETLDHLLGNV